MSQNITFLIIGDLHGRLPKLRTKEFDAIICPGDICGDDIRPYYKKWMEQEGDLLSSEFDEFCSPKIQEKFESKSIEKGRRVLQFLESCKKPVFLVPGNWDQTEIRDGMKVGKGNWKPLIKEFPKLNDVEHKKVNFKGLDLIGHGSTSAPEVLKKPTAKHLLFGEELYERELERFNYFSKVFKKLSSYFENSKNSTILLSHNVPYNTKLDKVKSNTYANGKHYGSLLARKLIEKYRPLLCIGGHIHEGFGSCKIGETLCINAGFGGDINTLVTIDVPGKRIIKVEHLGTSVT